MAILESIDTSIISLIILTGIYMNVYRQADKFFLKNPAFVHLLQTSMVLIVLSQTSIILNGTSGFINHLGSSMANAALFLIEPLASIFWIKYVSVQVFHNEESINKWMWLFRFVFVINAIIATTSLNTGWFYNLDANNVYSRGPLFLLHVAFVYSIVIYSVYFIIVNKHKIEKVVWYSLLMFPIPPVIGTVIQILFRGAYGFDGVAISLLIIYFYIQDCNLNTDYLTGTYNRRQLDSLIESKIKNSVKFSSIIIDINNFKSINDTFGHDVGDSALLDAVKIIKKSLRHNDFIARFGGDEFFIILDIDECTLLKKTAERIKESANHFNFSNRREYIISFSMGYDVYDPTSKMSADEFFKHIDKLMYLEKI